MNFKIDQAWNRLVIIEPIDKSTVLQADETATVFKVISIGGLVGKSDGNGQYFKYNELEIDNLIIVAQNSVEKTMMGNKEILYVHESNIITTVKNE